MQTEWWGCNEVVGTLKPFLLQHNLRRHKGMTYNRSIWAPALTPWVLNSNEPPGGISFTYYSLILVPQSTWCPKSLMWYHCLSSHEISAWKEMWFYEKARHNGGEHSCYGIRQQESIPVGCLPSAFVVTGGGMVHPQRAEWVTDTCENITFPQLLLLVLMNFLIIRDGNI